MTKQEQIHKLFNLLLVSKRKMTTKELCLALGVTPRTLIRYVYIARTNHHYPISSGRSRTGGYWVDVVNYTSPINKNAVSSIKAIKSLEGQYGIQEVFRKVNHKVNPSQIMFDI